MVERLDQYVLKTEVRIEEMLRQDPYDPEFCLPGPEVVEKEFWIRLLKTVDLYHLGEEGAEGWLQKVRNTPLDVPWKAYIDYGHDLAPVRSFRKLDRTDPQLVWRNFQLGLKSPNALQRKRFQAVKAWMQRGPETVSKVDFEVILTSLEQAQRSKGRVGDAIYDQDLGILKKCKVDFFKRNRLDKPASILSSVEKYAAEANGNSHSSKVDRLRKKLSAKMQVRNWI